MNNYICRILLNVSHAAICVSRVRTDVRVVGPRTTIYVSNTTRYVLDMHTTICVSCCYLFVSPQDWWSSGGASFFFAAIYVFLFLLDMYRIRQHTSASHLWWTSGLMLEWWGFISLFYNFTPRFVAQIPRELGIIYIYIYTLYNICIYMCVCK